MINPNTFKTSLIQESYSPRAELEGGRAHAKHFFYLVFKCMDSVIIKEMGPSNNKSLFTYLLNSPL